MKFNARILLIDCGKATKVTHGNGGPFGEAGVPPHNRQP
jgi:hypothetical protein